MSPSLPDFLGQFSDSEAHAHGNGSSSSSPKSLQPLSWLTVQRDKCVDVLEPLLTRDPEHRHCPLLLWEHVGGESRPRPGSQHVTGAKAHPVPTVVMLAPGLAGSELPQWGQLSRNLGT